MSENNGRDPLQRHRLPVLGFRVQRQQSIKLLEIKTH